MQVEMWNIAEIKPYPPNPRHNDQAVDAVPQSQARVMRAWNGVRDFRGESGDSEARKQFVSRIIDLVQVLVEEGLGPILDRLPAGDADRNQALEIYRLAKQPDDRGAIMDRLGKTEGATRGRVVAKIGDWLRWRLMEEILGHQPDPWDELLERCTSAEVVLENLEFLSCPQGQAEVVKDLWRRAWWIGGIDNPPPGRPPAEATKDQVLQAIAGLVHWAKERPGEETVAGENQRSDGKHRRKRGRPETSDPKADKRLSDAFRSSGCRRIKDYATMIHRPYKEVKKAIDRHRQRTRRQRNGGTK